MTNSAPKFILIEHGESGSPWVFRAFATEADRERATAEAIFTDGEVDDEHKDEWLSYVETLRDCGLLTFEGDPGLEWRTGWIEVSS